MALLRSLGGLLGSGLVVALALRASTASALRIENGNSPIQLDFTEDAAFDYHFRHGNGNIEPPTDPLYDPTSDNYLDWINRFEAQLATGPWHADLRFDSALFLNAPQIDLANALYAQAHPMQSQLPVKFWNLLENRYIDNFELEKISASYTSPHLEATLGDFYLSYGRGLVVSLRKIDALGVDTTLRGGTVTYRGGGFTANVAGGVTNVVNTDPSTGYVAPDPEDPIVAGRLEYRLAQLFAAGLEGATMWQNLGTLNLAQPTLGEMAKNIQQTPLSPLGFGSVSTNILPPGSTSAIRTRTENFGATLELPNLWSHGNAYAEFVHQFSCPAGETCNSAPNPKSEAPPRGNATYLGVNGYAGDFTLQLEFKDYDGFQAPTFSSLQSGTFTSFYQQDVYNNPPNLEEIWQEETGTSTIYGPRARLDWQISEHFKPYATFLYFVDSDNKYDIYAASGGLDANWQQHRSHVAFSGGYRREVYTDQSATPGVLYATEFWFQYDVIQVLTDRYALELDGLHRTHRDSAFPGYFIWDQGYAYLSLRHSRFSASTGIEYYTFEPSVDKPWYPNVSGSYTINQNLLVRAFVGGREAGLRCINGICRNYPGFSGASLELVAKY